MEIITGIVGWIILAVLGLVIVMLLPVILFALFFFKKAENMSKQQAIYMQQIFRPDLNNNEKQ